MAPLRPIGWRALAGTVALASGSLAASAVGVFLLETYAGVRDASTLFLLAVALVAYLRGSWAAVGAALGAFLAYNFLFVPPRFTFDVADPQRLLTLFLLLAVGVAIGRLTGLQWEQARRSDLREREARALFAVSQAIASAKRTTDALPELVAGLALNAQMARVWLGLGMPWPQEQVMADTAPGVELPALGPHSLLRRGSDHPQPQWLRLSPPGPPSAPRRDGLSLYRLELTDGEAVIGSLCCQRDLRIGPPSVEESRLLAAAANQIGQAIVRDRLTEQATELEVARRSEELKAALLDSVSHDLRTPLATIRATAGTLADPSLPIVPDEARAMAGEIDAEADRLARLVGDLLDMSRIAGGALQTRPEPLPLAEIVLASLQRARPGLGHRPLHVAIPDDLPAIAVDQVLANQVLDNLLDNVARHASADAEVRISAVREGNAVTLRVEDAGPGVPPEALPHLFEKFYRVTPRRRSARPGTGLGLALVKGLVEAMGGSASASKSGLGGLAIDLRLPIAREPPP
jgi:two-component system sensor histidine kinase KdpD